MKNNYEIFIDYKEDILEIVKTPARQPVQQIEGKYGIIFWQDINGNTVRISIPEPDILFGVDYDNIETFLMYSSS